MTNTPLPELDPTHIRFLREPVAALEGYSQATHNDRAFDHPTRVMDTLYDFVGNDVPPHAFHAALLHDLADRSSDELQKNARRYLGQYYENTSNEDRAYVFALLGDMELVESYATHYRQNFSHRNEELTGMVQADGNGNPIKRRVVPNHFWLVDSKMTEPELMLEALEAVNLESVLIKAAELLDNLNYPAKDKDVALLQDVFEAESFYAPLLEILGYDGFAMALRSRAAEARLQKSGNEAIVEDASQAINTVLDIGIGETLNELMGKLGSAFAMAPVVGQQSGSHSIHLGELVKQDAEKGTVMRGVWRVKSLGSLAMKLLRNGQEMPADIVGLTIIPESLDDVADYFSYLVRQLQQADGVALVNAPSRTEPVHIKGGGNFIEKVRSKLPAGTPVDVAGSSNHKEFQVAKVTIEYNGVPIEIQVMTEEDRLNSRTGLASHVAYKSEAGNVNPETLESIKSRRKELKERTINPKSKDRALKLAELCVGRTVRKV